MKFTKKNWNNKVLIYRDQNAISTHERLALLYEFFNSCNVWISRERVRNINIHVNYSASSRRHDIAWENNCNKNSF